MNAAYLSSNFILLQIPFATTFSLFKLQVWSFLFQSQIGVQQEWWLQINFNPT